jgi:multimeric flavodoxin WrbA
MARLLGVVGSPRRNGNTHALVSHIMEGAAQAEAHGDILLLGDLEIQECDGCHACWQGKPCSKADDMNGVYPRLVASDAIVLGTPVYWYGPTALMKAFVDRLVYFNCPANRRKIVGKPVVLAIPFEEENPGTAEPVVAFFQRCLDYLQMRLVGQILVPGVTRRAEVLERPERLEEARQLGRRLAGSVEPT